MRTVLNVFGVLGVLTVASRADVVDVVVTGTVEFNQINSGPFDAVDAGDRATIAFSVDSNAFTNSASFPTRGCNADVDRSGEVDVDDLVAVILDWDCVGVSCIGDANGDGTTDVDDLLEVVLRWGPC